MNESHMQHYIILVLVIVIFGLMIYQITMQESQEDRYYLSIILTAANPTTPGNLKYPNDESGTLPGAIKVVAQNFSSYYKISGFNTPDWSKWSLDIVPALSTDTGAVQNMYYHFSFPLTNTQVNSSNLVGRPLGAVVGGSTLNEVFSGNDLLWVQTFFNNNVKGSLTYGDR